jgi:hypothetical protein
MFFWATVAGAGILLLIAIVSWLRWMRERHVRDEKDALDYQDFVELGRAAWIDLRDDDRTRLSH